MTDEGKAMHSRIRYLRYLTYLIPFLPFVAAITLYLVHHGAFAAPHH